MTGGYEERKRDGRGAGEGEGGRERHGVNSPVEG